MSAATVPPTVYPVRLIISPKEAFANMQKYGRLRTQDTWDQILVLSTCSGAFVALGAYFALVTGGNVPELRQTNPGIARLIYGVTFTLGIILTVFTGSHLLTGNVFAIPMMLYSKKTTLDAVWHSLKNIVFTTIGNFAGAVLVGYFLVYLLNYGSEEAWIDYLKKISEDKVTKNVGLLFVSAIGCNLLVCLAVYVASASEDTTGKIIGMFFPIAGFAAIGFEHVVANMFFLPTAAMFGANIPVWRMFFWNLLPVLLGNYVGGGVIIGLAFWYSYIWRNKHKHLVSNAVASMKQKLGKNLHQEPTIVMADHQEKLASVTTAPLSTVDSHSLDLEEGGVRAAVTLNEDDTPPHPVTTVVVPVEPSSNAEV